MKTNAAMKELLSGTALVNSLVQSLRDIVDNGFIHQDGGYFIATLFPKAKNVTRDNFPDFTGYECFVNSIHIEDYDDKDALCQAIQFVVGVFCAWREWMPTLTLVAIVSVSELDVDELGVDEFSVVAKFHVKRSKEQWVSENLEGYIDAIMVMESSENLTMFTALSECDSC